jgi:uncharacterized paraquat-inducible protein A
MSKIIRGTKDAHAVGTVVKEGAGGGGLRKIRCSGCGAFATEATLTNGQRAYVCKCGKVYGVSAM